MYSNRSRGIGAAVFSVVFCVFSLVGFSNGNIGIAILFSGISVFLLWSAYQHLKTTQPLQIEPNQVVAAKAAARTNVISSQTEQQGEIERAQLRLKLSTSIEAQDNLMITDIAKVLHEMPEGSSVVAFRKYRGTVLAGIVVLHGNTVKALEMFRNGHLNPESSPSLWRLIPEAKLNILHEFEDPPEGALAFFVLTPSGDYSFAFSHLVRSDGRVHWISDATWVCQVAETLVNVGIFESDMSPRTL